MTKHKKVRSFEKLYEEIRRPPILLSPVKATGPASKALFKAIERNKRVRARANTTKALTQANRIAMGMLRNEDDKNKTSDLKMLLSILDGVTK